MWPNSATEGLRTWENDVSFAVKKVGLALRDPGDEDKRG